MSRSTRTGRPLRVLALADDLSGAAETAAALGLRGRIVLGPVTEPSPGVEPVEPGSATAAPLERETVVMDLDTRQLAPDEGRPRAVTAALAHADGGVVLKKIDSLLRGNLAAETAAYARGVTGVRHRARPAGRRPHRARGRRQPARHRPAHDRRLACRAGRGAGWSVAAALGGLPTRVVPLAVVRAPAARSCTPGCGRSSPTGTTRCATRRRTRISTRSPRRPFNWVRAYG